MQNNINDYEYSNFSQNGEDGIIELLLSHIINNEKYFVEIGCGNGLENNSTNLILNDYYGLVCDMPYNIKYYNNLLKIIKPKKKISTISGAIDLDNLDKLIKILSQKEIDFFSLDIDSYDFFIMNEVLKNNIFPKVVCVEYNSFLGMEPLSLKYITNFQRYKLDTKLGLCYGASLGAFKMLFDKYGYKFIGVDKNGVNAFFILPTYLSKEIDNFYGLEFEYTKVFVDKYKTDGKTIQNYILSNFKDSLINTETLI